MSFFILIMPFFASENDRHDMALLASEGERRLIFNVYVPGCNLTRLNQPQSGAVKKALTQRFTVIQGPPGTHY